MARSASFIICLWVLLALGLYPGLAQQTAHLKPQLEKLQQARKVEQKAIARKDSLSLAEAYYLYGKIYSFTGNYRASQGYFLKSLQILERRGDSYELSRLYVRLSENEGRLGRLTEALHYADLAMGVAKRIKSTKALVRTYGVLGRVHEHLWNGKLSGNGAEAKTILAYYKNEENLCYRLNDTLCIAEASLEVGTFLARLNNPQAIPYLKKSLRLFTNRKDKLRANVMLHLASAYLTFGKYPLAFQTLLEAEKAYTHNQEDKYDTILGLELQYVRYFQKTGQWQEAFEHLEKVKALETSHFMSDRDGTIAQLNVAYETEKKEAQLNVQKKELALRAENIRGQQRFTIATSGLLAISAGLSLLFFRLYRKNQRISRQNEELVREQNHRVKNNLQVVSSLLSLQSKRLTDEAARKAVEESRLRIQSMAILHQRLYDGDRLAAVNLDEFVRELVGGVLKAFGYPSIRVNVAVKDITLEADKAVPLGLILNEVVTNACKYAFPASENPALTIACQRRGHKVELNVTDNGPGLERSERLTLWDDDRPVTVKKSFGMTLIQSQVAQLNGTYQYTSAGAGSFGVGTTFTMEFNV